MDEKINKLQAMSVNVEAGKTYSWCTCGLSQNQPLCDGAHKGVSELKSLKWQAPNTETIYMCSCKATKNPPFCDGSHSQL